MKDLKQKTEGKINKCEKKIEEVKDRMYSGEVSCRRTESHIVSFESNSAEDQITGKSDINISIFHTITARVTWNLYIHLHFGSSILTKLINPELFKTHGTKITCHLFSFLCKAYKLVMHN